MDIKAVRNAMIYHVSNGITEGFVNKLKTIKRVMYGKAKLPPRLFHLGYPFGGIISLRGREAEGAEV